MVEARSYDDANPLVSIMVTKNGTTLASFDYILAKIDKTAEQR